MWSGLGGVSGYQSDLLYMLKEFYRFSVAALNIDSNGTDHVNSSKSCDD